MAGQHGNTKVTTQNLEVIEGDLERGLLLVRGAVPGPKGGLVFIRNAAKGPVVEFVLPSTEPLVEEEVVEADVAGVESEVEATTDGGDTE